MRRNEYYWNLNRLRGYLLAAIKREEFENAVEGIRKHNWIMKVHFHWGISLSFFSDVRQSTWIKRKFIIQVSSKLLYFLSSLNYKRPEFLVRTRYEWARSPRYHFYTDELILRNHSLSISTRRYITMQASWFSLPRPWSDRFSSLVEEARLPTRRRLMQKLRIFSPFRSRFIGNVRAISSSIAFISDTMTRR